MRVRISVFLVMYLCLLAISPAGAEGRSSGYGVSPPFHLDTRHNLADLYLYPEDISWTSVGGGNVQITAVIYNTGKSASNVGVRFLQSDMSQGLGQAAPIAQDQWIAQIDSAGSAQVQVQWAPPSDDRMLYVIADPTDQIAEDVESNNTAQKPYSGEGPVIAAITAHWDGLEEDDRIGMFITGIEAYNTIEAQVEDANGPDDVQLVVFRTEDDVIRVEDTNGADGWSAQIDMGLVSYPKRLIVEAQDAQGLWGSRAVQLEGITIPEWLSGGDAVVEAFVFEEGIYDCEIRFPGEPVPSNSQVPDSVLLLGGLRNDLQTQLKAAAHYFIEGYGRIGGGGVIEGGVLQSESYGPNLELDVEVGAQLNEQFELMGIYAGANASLAFPIPEVEHGWPIMVAGIPIWISISVGGDVTILVGAEYVLNTNLEFIDGTHITPGLGIHVVLTAAIEILFGIAELRFVGEPMAQIELTVEYTTQTGASSSWCGSFIVPYAIWGSIGWGLWEEELYSSALPAPGEPWEFGDCGALMTERLRQRYARGGVFRAPRPPEIFPDPDLTAGSGDKVVVVWVSDRDPNPEAVNPEVYSMFRSGNTWSDPSPVTSNALFETNPVVAYLPDGLPMALWTQNNLAQRDSASFAATLENQEIYCSLWSAEDSTWSEAVEITTDDPGQLGDGMVQGAFGADNVGLCVWVRTTDDDLETRTDWEIFFASWIDSTAWSPPDPITNDAAADCSPNVAILPDGRGLAVWLRDDDTDFSTTDDTHIVYAIWDGTTWTPPSALSTSGSIKQDPRLAVTPSGRAMVTWMETVAFADSAKADSVRVIISDPGVTGWGPIQTAVGSDHFLQRPQPHVARVRDSEIAMVAWRGHDGYDGDLFASMLDLSEPLAEWTEPTAILSDTLTDWMATSAIDSLGNALFFSVKTDWSDGRGRPAVGTMTDGLSFMAKGVKPNLEFGDELNFGALPVAPDLDLRGENIWFTVDEDTVLYAGEGDLIEVHARVINAGDVESAESAVRFFDAHPDSSGGQIGADQLLPVLPPDTAHETRIEWTAVGGVHQLFAWADPDSGQAEQGEDNNLASAILYITPDMSADSLSFSKSNPLLGDPITLTAHISNHGGTAAADVVVRFYDGDPADSSTVQVGEDQLIGQIAVGASEEVSIEWVSNVGRREIHVLADPDNEVPEADEADNLTSREIRVLADLAISTEDISFQGSGPDDIPIRVTLHNQGGVDAESFMVRFYDNDPLLDGVAADSTVIYVTCFDSLLVSTIEATDTDTLTSLWRDPPVGVFDVHVVADADSAITERNENNNKAAASLFVQGSVDLTIGSEDITHHLEQGASADTLHLICQVHNLGASGAANVVVHFYEDHPDSGQFLAAMAVPFVAAGDSASGFARWPVPGTGYPVLPIFAFVDAWNAIPETDEGNNIAGRDLAMDILDPHAPPTQFTLWQNYPNPFRAVTYVRFDLPRKMEVEVSVYDVSGRRVRRLHEGIMPAGRYALAWRGRDDRAVPVPIGVYFYEIRTPTDTARRKMILVR